MSKTLAQLIVTLHKLTAPLRNWLLLVVYGHVSECKHSPTCSEYFLTQVTQNGWSGFLPALRRLLSCR